MPLPKRQTNLPPPVDSGANVLKRIAPIRAVDTSLVRQKWALYGQPKTGKTRFACSFRKPLLLIGAEDGTASVVGTKGVDFVQLRHTDELGELIREVGSGRWDTVVLDTASRLRDMRISEILGLSAMPTQKSFGFARREQWMECAQNLKDMLRPLLDYPRVMDLNVVVISQEQNLVFDDGATGSDLLRPSIGSALGKSLCDWLHAECDYIAQTLIRDQVVQNTVGVAGESVVLSERTGKKEYCLRVSPDGIYQAGFRLPEGRKLDREFIVDPTYEKVCELIRGKKS